MSEKQIAGILTVEKSIQLARQGYIKLAKKQSVNPLRTWFTVPGGSSFYFMPSYVFGHPTVATKIVSVNHQNPKKGLPATIATIFLFDAKTGEKVAQLAGESLTAIRTAASSALATDVLARKDADTLGIIGTGVQAQAHLAAMLNVRNFSLVMVYSRSRAHRTTFSRKFGKKHNVPIIAASSANDVARDSNVLVVATSSPVPVFDGSAVRPGTHVNAIGSGLPNMREVDTTLVKRSLVVVDSKAQAFASYGEILIPLNAGAITRSHVRAELGEILLRRSGFRRRDEDITLFKAGGLAVLDAIFADFVISQQKHV